MVKALILLGAVNNFARFVSILLKFFVECRHLLLLRNCVSFVKIGTAKAALMVVNGTLFTAKLCHFDSKVKLGQIFALCLRHLRSRVDEMRVSNVDFYLLCLHNSFT